MSEDVFAFGQVMTIIVLSTAALVAIALGARVLWRMGSAKQQARRLPHDEEHQQRLEHSIDAIAIEVERISEAQRFMVGLLSESLPAGRAERELASPARDGRVITPH